MLIVQINAPEEATHNIPCVELDDVPIASDTVSVADSYNPDELDSEHLCHYDMSTTCQQHFQLSVWT